jgi:hypothetical protein
MLETKIEMGAAGGMLLDDEAVAFGFHTLGPRLRRLAEIPLRLVFGEKVAAASPRRFFARQGVAGYRIVESVGATEATPVAGTAELIVDITTTGTTLRANHLKVLDDGLILKSQAHLFASRAALWDAAAAKRRDAIVAKLSSSPRGE